MGLLKLKPKFRRLVKKDIDEIMEIENQCYQFPWTKQIMLESLDFNFPLALLIENKIAGYIVLSYGAQESHILNLCISGKFQGNKLGMKLLKEGLQRVKKYHNVKNAYLEVRISNNFAIATYHEYGFNEIGYRNDYYPSKRNREDAIIMAKTI